MSKKFLIVQASIPRTGSTVLANMLYGFLAHDQCVIFHGLGGRENPTAPDSIFDYLNDRQILIIKTHTLHFDIWQRIAEHTKRQLFFVCTSRNGASPNPPENNSVVIDFQEILETKNNPVETIVDKVQKKLELLFADYPELVLNTEKCIWRIKEMNKSEHALRHITFSYKGPFFGIHGGHRSTQRIRAVEHLLDITLPKRWAISLRLQIIGPQAPIKKFKTKIRKFKTFFKRTNK